MMKKACISWTRVVLLLAGTILLGLLSGTTAQAQEDFYTLRMMTYNIQHGAGIDDVVNLDRQAAVIRNATPDLVGVQEVDSFVKRSGRIDETAYLAKSLGMYGTFGPAIPLTGGKYGVAILSKEQPLSVSNTPLPGSEPRTLLVCEFENYVFATTHLDLNESDRLASLPIILEEAARWEKPFFICGDWNDKPSSTLIKNMKKSFVFLNNLTENSANYTFPANEPKSIIDYIASYGRVTRSIRKRQVINEPQASDHRPVLVEVTMNLPTGIGLIDNLQLTIDNRDVLYDITGRRLDRKPTKKGIYIHNGKKVLY
ncbi:MAG: endonuclease/exonuclease/phosphatase family protein [Bacteroidaceae bacterium]|nr:endonuclease/exonuclease/phosphatase family protein [Bacteroidaceae bacterium]